MLKAWGTEDVYMGEIKSTLDLVMEKTRNLTLSDEEKQVQKLKETENRIKGLLQKLLDGLLTKNQISQEYERIKKEADLSDNKIFVDEVIGRLDPDQGAPIMLEVLEECCGLKTASFQAVIDEYHKSYHQAVQNRTAQLKEHLAQKHSVAGTAVIPNLDADEQWQQTAQDMRRQFESKLNRAYEMTIEY